MDTTDATAIQGPLLRTLEHPFPGGFSKEGILVGKIHFTHFFPVFDDLIRQFYIVRSQKLRTKSCN